MLNPSSFVEWMSIKPIAEPIASPSAAAKKPAVHGDQ